MLTSCSDSAQIEECQQTRIHSFAVVEQARIKKHDQFVYVKWCDGFLSLQTFTGSILLDESLRAVTTNCSADVADDFGRFHVDSILKCFKKAIKFCNSLLLSLLSLLILIVDFPTPLAGRFPPDVMLRIFFLGWFPWTLHQGKLHKSKKHSDCKSLQTKNWLHNFVATCSQATVMVVVMVVATVVVIMAVVMLPIIMVVLIVMLFFMAMLNPESFPWFERLPTTHFLLADCKM